MHPRHRLTRIDFGLFDIWQRCRPGELGGGGHLPFTGGVASQPTCVIAALDMMDDACARLRPRSED